MSKLESLEPARAVRMYLEVRQDELVDRTLKSHEHRLRAFVEWCGELGVDDLIEFDGRDLYGLRVWRCEGNFGVEDGETPEEIAPVTFKPQLTTLRAFLRFAANTHVVSEDFYKWVPLPKLSGTDDVSDSTLEPDRATGILGYLHRYRYASRRHAEFALLQEAGARMGAICGLDLCDFDLDGRTSAVRYKHRPDQGTPIKNGEKGEWFNSVSDRMGTMLQAYTDGLRVDKTDEFGRKPLLMTSHRRVSMNTIQQDVYVATRPYWLNRGCPHDRDIETCEAVELNYVSTCPSPRSPHDARKEVVMLYRREEVPRRVVSDRPDANDLVFDKRYDHRGKRERAERRWNHFPW